MAGMTSFHAEKCCHLVTARQLCIVCSSARQFLIYSIFMLVVSANIVSNYLHSEPANGNAQPENPDPQERYRTPEHVRLLRRHHRYLKEHLPPIVYKIAEEMLRNNRLSGEDYDRIIRQETPGNSVAMLLATMQARQRQMFNGFLQSLRELGCDDVLAVLNDHVPLGEINEAFAEVHNVV